MEKKRNISGFPRELAWLQGTIIFFQGEKIGSSSGVKRVTGPGKRAITQGNKPSTKAAPAPNAQGKKPIPGCDTVSLLMMLGLLAFFYFFLILPQRKQEKRRREMLGALKKNDKVITTSGIHGTIVAMDERTVTLKIDEKGDVRVKFEKSAISSIVSKQKPQNQDQAK